MPRDRPPGIWESLKRALGGVGAEPPRAPAAAPALTELPAVVPERESLTSAPPFLPDSEGPDSPLSHAAPEQPPAVSDVSPSPVEPAPPPDGPRLARGLASFSRSNADREKKFAHLLHDDEPGGKKKPRA